MNLKFGCLYRKSIKRISPLTSPPRRHITLESQKQGLQKAYIYRKQRNEPHQNINEESEVLSTIQRLS